MSAPTLVSASEDQVGFRPLYGQVRDALRRRLAEGVWQPGQLLPSEGRLARELGVSPGTVRKALDALTADSLLVRRQGRGTFVAAHDEAQSIFRFFRLTRDDGAACDPESRVLARAEAPADEAERARLALPPGALVVRIERLRRLGPETEGGAPCIHERITAPAALFPGLAALDLPNTLYALYAGRFGVTIARADERLKAVALDARGAALLAVAEGHPALAVDRTAYDLDGRPVEWRLSTCLTDALHYRSDLG
jgi:GntR family transcriptional regulator